MTESEPKYTLDTEDTAGAFDFDKLVITFRRLLPWIILLFIVILSGTFIYLRYTKPVYESGSVLKLDIRNEGSVFGLNTNEEDQSYKTISSEIELLKSRLFFSNVIRELNLEVTVFTIGKVLVDERYKNSPIDVKYFMKGQGLYDTPIHIEILNSGEYEMSFSAGGHEYSGTYSFGDTVENEFVKWVISLTPVYNASYQEEKLYFVINSEQSLLNYLAVNLNVQPLNLNANTIQITFTDYNKFKARDLVNAIDTIYLNYTRNEKSLANTQKIGFIDEQLKSTEERLNDYENYFENFTIEYKTTDLQHDLNKSISLQNALDSEIYQLRTKLSRMKQISQDLSDSGEISLNLADQDLLPGELKKSIQEIDNLVIERQMLSQSYNSKTQVWQNLNSKIVLYTDHLKTSLASYIDLINDQLAYLSRQQKALEKEFLSIPSKSTEYTKIDRYYKLYENFYLTLMQKRAEFQLALAGTVTDFKILSSANLPAVPIQPKRWIIYGVSLMSWSVMSLLLTGLFYLLNNKINGMEEMEKATAFPILGSIPFYTTERLKESRLVIEKGSRSLISESFRSIRTNMQFLVSKKETLVVSISSSISGEGKTFVAMNMAAVMALSDKKVVLVDLDMRQPKIHKILGDNNARGVSTVLSGQDVIEDCIRRTALDRFEYLAAGPVPPNPSELIMSGEFDKMINYLSGKYDVVFLDTPPIGLVTDGVLTMKKTDIQIFVLRAEYSNKQFLSHIEKLNAIHHFPCLALILNAVKKSRNLHYGYGSQHGYYTDPSAKP